jgi:poly-gamma-glutamate system protein
MAIAAVLSLLAVGTVELFPSKPSASAGNEKLLAANLANEAFAAVKAERLKREIAIDPVTDPAQSGLVGELISPVTSNHGVLSAKQATVNPNFAAVVVDMLKQAGVKPGDRVAVGFSSSFPAINISVIAALETLGAKPLIISSASGSQWGANHPDLLWIDMEAALNEAGVFSSRSIAASLGGVEDRGVGMSAESIELLRAAISRNNLPVIEPADFFDGINQRMLLYHKHAQGAPIKAYINVGGGTTSVGTHIGKKQFAPGLNLNPPVAAELEDSVMARFAAENVPVIHLVQIHDLAAVYGLPAHIAAMPPVGEGGVYAPQSYNTYLAAGGMMAIVLLLGLPGFLDKWDRFRTQARFARPLGATNGHRPRNPPIVGHILAEERNNRDHSSPASAEREPIL